LDSGIVLIDKPAGCSSAAVVAIVKRWLKARNPSIKRVGHAGTLDPGATGLLVVLFGSATRLAHYAEAGWKEYSGTISLGVTSSTDDSDGEILSECDVNVSDDAIALAIKALTGEILQVPPAVSAVKVAGKRAYALARQGIEVSLKQRAVTVFQFDVERLSNTELAYRVACSKGTYIRSLARDLGEQVGCGALISSLRREGSYPFTTAEALPLSKFQDAGISEAVNFEVNMAETCLPWLKLFPKTPYLLLPKDLGSQLAMGNKAALVELERSEAVLEWVAAQKAGMVAQDEATPPFDVKLLYGVSGVTTAELGVSAEAAERAEWKGIIQVVSAESGALTLNLLVNIP
jgi:tRNA pseudouridine55 synthase